MKVCKNFLKLSGSAAAIFFLAAGIFIPEKAEAYYQEIGADIQEVYAAVLQVFQPYGITKQDDQNFQIETDWRGVLRASRSEKIK